MTQRNTHWTAARELIHRAARLRDAGRKDEAFALIDRIDEEMDIAKAVDAEAKREQDTPTASPAATPQDQHRELVAGLMGRRPETNGATTS